VFCLTRVRDFLTIFDSDSCCMILFTENVLNNSRFSTVPNAESRIKCTSETRIEPKEYVLDDQGNRMLTIPQFQYVATCPDSTVPATLQPGDARPPRDRTPPVIRCYSIWNRHQTRLVASRDTALMSAVLRKVPQRFLGVVSCGSHRTNQQPASPVRRHRRRSADDRISRT
jgi:hypothetical protein